MAFQCYLALQKQLQLVEKDEPFYNTMTFFLVPHKNKFTREDQYFITEMGKVSAASYLRTANTLLAQKEYSQAIPYCEQAMQCVDLWEPKAHFGPFHLAFRLYLGAENHKAAWKVWKKIESFLQKDRSDQLKTKVEIVDWIKAAGSACTLVETDKLGVAYEDCLRYCEIATQKDKKNEYAADIVDIKVACFFYQKNYKSCWKCTKSDLFDAEKISGDTAYSLAISAVELNETQGFLQYATKALSLGVPDAQKAYLLGHLINHYNRNKDTKSLIPLLEEVCSLNNTQPGLFSRETLSAAYVGAGRYEDALIYALKELETAKTEYETAILIREISFLYLRLGKGEEALKNIKFVFDQLPNLSEKFSITDKAKTYFLMAQVVACFLKDYESALDYCKQASEFEGLSPGDTTILFYLQSLLFLAAKKYNEALFHAESALAAFPAESGISVEKVDVLNAAAHAAYQLHNSEKIFQYNKAILEITPNPDVFTLLANEAIQQEDKQELKWLREFSEKNDAVVNYNNWKIVSRIDELLSPPSPVELAEGSTSTPSTDGTTKKPQQAVRVEIQPQASSSVLPEQEPFLKKIKRKTHKTANRISDSFSANFQIGLFGIPRGKNVGAPKNIAHKNVTVTAYPVRKTVNNYCIIDTTSDSIKELMEKNPDCFKKFQEEISQVRRCGSEGEQGITGFKGNKKGYKFEFKLLDKFGDERLLGRHVKQQDGSSLIVFDLSKNHKGMMRLLPKQGIGR